MKCLDCGYWSVKDSKKCPKCHGTRIVYEKSENEIDYLEEEQREQFKIVENDYLIKKLLTIADIVKKCCIVDLVLSIILLLFAIFLESSALAITGVLNILAAIVAYYILPTHFEWQARMLVNTSNK